MEIEWIAVGDSYVRLAAVNYADIDEFLMDIRRCDTARMVAEQASRRGINAEVYPK